MKRASTFDLMLPARNGAMPVYEWLYSALRAQILAGNLRPQTRLPATRDLARQYRLSRGTVVLAFDQLKSEGYLESQIGSGTYVSRILPEELLQVRTRSTATPTPGRNQRIAFSGYGRRARLFNGYQSKPTRAFRSNLPALDLFPTELWAQVTARCLRRASTHLLMGCEPFGYVPLREAVAEYLRSSRGVKCDAEQVMIVSGAQEALDLTARLLVNRDDKVCIEDPGYTGAASVFEAYGADLVCADVDDEGVKVHRLPVRDVRLIYVTPGHQFPLGTTMSLARRLQLLEWARQSGAVILEDDYDSEYRYAGRPIPALQGLDRTGLVLYTGTFSKVLFPSLRLGYMVVPSHLVERFQAAKSITDRHAPLLEQAVLREFMTEGHFGRHVRRMREVYAERLGVLLHEARARLNGMLEIKGVKAGLQTAAWLCDDIDSELGAAAAAKRDVEVTPLSRYARRKMKHDGFQLGFAAVDAREIKRGVQALAIALEATQRSKSRGDS